MLSFFKYLIILTLLTMNSLSSASSFPRGCQVSGFGYHENYLILNDNETQKFYLIQNRSNASVELEHHEINESFMSPKLHSKLDPSNWSAFASDISNLHFKCYTQDGENITILNCNDVLDVCQYPRVKFALSNMGNYWVSTNKDKSQVIKEAAAKGILLRW